MIREKTAERRKRVLMEARWCFLNFGFAKTSFEDIAQRANLSRTLLYRLFKNKEDIFTAVFADWMIARHPAAQEAANAPGPAFGRMLTVCRLMVLEPWADMARAPMGSEFFDVCGRIDPAIEAQHRSVALECVTSILKDRQSAEVFLLSLDGFFADEPAMEVLEQRIRILATRFTQFTAKTKPQSGDLK